MRILLIAAALFTSVIGSASASGEWRPDARTHFLCEGTKSVERILRSMERDAGPFTTIRGFLRSGECLFTPDWIPVRAIRVMKEISVSGSPAVIMAVEAADGSMWMTWILHHTAEDVEKVIEGRVT